MRSLILWTFTTGLLFFSSAHADDDDKTICMDGYRRVLTSDDKIAACKRFLETKTGTPHEIGMAHGLIGFAFYKSKRYAAAIEEYETEIKIDPNFVFPYIMISSSYRRLGNFDKAIEIANSAIALEPKNYSPLQERGLANADKGDFDAAIIDLDNAAKLSATSDRTPAVQVARAQALTAKKDFASAIEMFDSILKNIPTYKEAIIGRCDALKASNGAKEQLDACSSTISEFDAVTCDDYNTTTADNRAAACNRIFAATAPSGHALAIAHIWKGLEFARKRQGDAALAEYDLAVQAAPDFWDSYNVRASAKKELKNDLPGALADYDEAIKRNPPRYNVYEFRGKARILTGDYEGAISDLTIAMSHYISPLEAMIDRGRAKVYKKDFDGAIADLTPPIDKPVVAQLARAYIIRCSAYNGKGNSEAAISDCNAAIHINSNYAPAYDYRGVAYVAQGKLAEALADFNTAIKISPNYIGYYADRGSLYERQKDFDNARADYQVVVTKSAPFETPITAAVRQTARQRLAALPQPVVTPLPQKDGALAGSTRVALVIGNGAYKNVPALPNPPKDANAVAKSLEGVGFSVVRLADDMPRDGFLQALRAFSRDAAKADWAVVYYAGHGMEIGGVNYLIPVDAKLEQDKDAEKEAVSLELVIAAVSGAKKLRLVLLDACRNNPFADKMTRSIGVQLVNKGLSNIEPDAGIMVVYATKHGETALDGSGAHSPFATAFMSDIPKPGIEVRRLFDVVRDDVMKATNREQQPFSYGSLPGSQDFYFVAGK